MLIVYALAAPRESGWLFVGGGFTIVGLAAAALLVSVLDTGSNLARAFSCGPAVALGRASLLRVPVARAGLRGVANRRAARSPVVRIVAALAGRATATAASYRPVEMPAARLRRRLAGRGLARPSPVTARPA